MPRWAVRPTWASFQSKQTPESQFAGIGGGGNREGGKIMPPFSFSRKCKKIEREKKKSSSGRRRHSNKLSSCIQIFIRRVVNSRFRFRVFFGFSVSCAACLSFVSPKFFFPGTPREQKKKKNWNQSTNSCFCQLRSNHSWDIYCGDKMRLNS